MLALVVLSGALVGFGSTAHAAAPLTVTTAADSGPGSLRQAILDANATPELDNIAFAIPGAGIHVIVLATALPAITAPVSIDARTQPGYAGRPLIEVDGIHDRATFDLDNAAASGSTISGLAFAGYHQAVLTHGAVTVQDSWVGLHADGSAGPGVANELSNQAYGVVLGTGSAIRHSVIGRNGFAGVDVCGHGIDIADSRIGTDATGLAPMPNLYGVLSFASCAYPAPDTSTGMVTIGRPGHGNVISGNVYLGVITEQTDVVVQSNLIGVGADGSTPLPNDGGIGLQPGAKGAVIDHNVIRDNGHYGVETNASDVVVMGNDVTGNALGGIGVSTGANVQIRGNRVDGNGGLGIDLGVAGVEPNDNGDADSGPNGLQNFPTLSSVSRSGSLLTIGGSLSTTPGANATIEVFQSAQCDPSGYGEGAVPRGSVTTSVPASGTASWQMQLPVDDASGAAWSATATTADGTSEFSACKTDTMAVTPQPTLTAWQPIGGAAKGAPSVAAPASDTFDTVIRGLDDQIWYTDKPAGGQAWTPWRSIGGLTLSSPAASAHEVVVRGIDNALWLHPLGQGSAWQPLGGLTLDSPALASTPDGVLHLFIRGVDNALWHRERSDGGQWGPWQNLGGRLTAGPASSVTAKGEIDVAVRGADGAVWLSALPGGGAWSAWFSLGGGLRDAPAMATFADGSLHLFVRGLDNQLWHRARSPQGTWSSYAPFGGALTSGPGVATDPDANRSAMTIAAMGVDGQLWTRRYEVDVPA